MRYSNKTIWKDRRRRLRLQSTKAEYVLWQELRRRKLGVKFRRQFNIGPFIVDFYCHSLKLIIEADGPIHQYQIEYDRYRNAWLRSKEHTVLRFTNDAILFERESVMKIIGNSISKAHL